MSNKRKLLKKCKGLPFTKRKILSDQVMESTVSGLNNLFMEYDYASVLGTLSSVWKFEEATRFFGKIDQCVREKRKIRTIATVYYRAYLGGVERVNAELMNIWEKMGLRVVFFTEEPENVLDFPYPQSVKRIIIPPKTDMNARLAALQAHCIEERVDLFVNHEWGQQTFIWECLLMRKLHIYFAQYCHGHFACCFAKGKGYLFQPESFKLCDIVFAISETNAKFYQLCGCNTYLLQNPVSSNLSSVNVLAQLDSNRILLVGRLSCDKNPLEAIEIFKIVHNELPEVVLDVVGDGDMAECMHSSVRAQGLERFVVFHGAKNSGELDVYYRNAACVLFTSKMEGYPMVLLESKAYGLPLVMYDLSYLSLVKGGKGILSAPIGDCHKLAGQLIKIMRDKKFRHKLGNEARESFVFFDSHDHIADWNNIFRILHGDMSDNWTSLYFPNQLDDSERTILPMLFDVLKVAGESLDYRVGGIMLTIPRKIYCIFQRIKRSVFR